MANFDHSGSRIPDAWSEKHSSHTIALIKGTILLFLKQDKAVYLLTKFQVSSITLTSFRQGEGVILPLPPLTPKRTSKKATQIRVKIDPLQLFLKSYKDNCTTLILCNKASALKLNFKNKIALRM